MPTRLRLTLSVAFACAGASSALADPQPPHGPQTAEGRPPASNHPVKPPETVVAAHDTATQFQRNGGSLLRASMASAAAEAADNPTHHAREVSYWAIPEPEPRTIRKHDIVNVVIHEESSFSSQATSDLKRESTLDARIEEMIKLKLGNFAIQGNAQGPNPPAIKGNANRTFKGEATQDRTDSLIARMAAEVVDVKPNGTLVLQARKTIKTDEEVQAFILTGTCRVEDIVAADNSVISSQLYDLRLEKNTKGQVTATTKQGLIGKFLNLINLF